MLTGDDQITQIQQAIDLVSLIGEQLRLQPRGREFVGLCPFHEDTKPSLNVVPHKQIFHCFACSTGGDAFQWMIKYHKMTFPDALRYLADRAGIKLLSRPGTRDNQDTDQSDRKLLAQANAAALSFFRKMLHDVKIGRAAHAYLEHRGVRDDITEAFELGYAPDAWDTLAQAAARNRWNERAMRQAGLISPRSQGEGDYDRMRHRLIFPICDELGKPIAFGGRTLPAGSLGDKNEAKYLNSPETALFNKSATLYGLHMAKKVIIDSRTAVVVEGYTDVIACHQGGFTNVVATLGTALTAQHVSRLRRFADRVVLIFDADEAGQKAADRAVEIFLTGDLDVGVAILPDGLDPAELLARPEGAVAWNKAVNAADDALDYQFNRVRSHLDAAATLTARQRIIEDYLRQLAQLGLTRQGLVRRALIMQRLGDLLDLPASQVTAMVKAMAPPQTPRPPVQAGARGGTPQVIGQESEKNADISIAEEEMPPKIRAIRLAEQHLIGGLLREPSLFDQAHWNGRSLEEAVAPSEMVTQDAKRVYELIFNRLCDGRGLALTDLLADLASRGEPSLCDWATQAEAQAEQLTGGNAHKLRELVTQAAAAIQNHQHQREYTEVRNQRTRETTQGIEQDDERLRRLFEHQKAHPSSVRIARVEQ